MIEEEVKQQAEKTCIMKDKNDRACYVAGFLGGFYEGEKSRYEYEEKQTQTIIDQQTKIALLSQKVYDLQKQSDKLNIPEEYKWHDLRKFPADLPPQREKVFIAQEYDKYNLRGGVPMIAWRDGDCWMSIDDRVELPIGWKVYAWHKIPKIPEEYK